MSKKLNKKQFREKQALDNKKFNRVLIVSFCFSIVIGVSVLFFYIYDCDTRFFYRKRAWYGKMIPGDWVCMIHDGMRHHESYKVELDDKTFYVCSHNCHLHFIDHYKEHASIPDAYSGDSICKAEAIIGLKEKGQPTIVYFKNEETFDKYYKK
jgi:hypothetical protein